jgi:hypothetical protein
LDQQHEQLAPQLALLQIHLLHQLQLPPLALLLSADSKNVEDNTLGGRDGASQWVKKKMPRVPSPQPACLP